MKIIEGKPENVIRGESIIGSDSDIEQTCNEIYWQNRCRESERKNSQLNSDFQTVAYSASCLLYALRKQEVCDDCRPKICECKPDDPNEPSHCSCHTDDELLKGIAQQLENAIREQVDKLKRVHLLGIMDMPPDNWREMFRGN